MATTWGDPTADSFRKKHIREARAAGAEALVNAQITDVVERLIEGLSDAHVDIPEVVASFNAAGTPAQRLGLALHLAIPAPPSKDVAALVARWGFDGFEVDGSTLIELRFEGTPADALTLNEEAIAARLDTLESEDVSGPSPTKWPGARDLEVGDFGQDVQFLRLVLNVGSPDQPVDGELIAAVNRFMIKRGAPLSGRIDVDFWRRLLPAKRPLLSQGESGLPVRLLQAALAAYESSETRVSGTWGVLTSRDVTALQKDYNLRVVSFVRAPEWALLLGPESPRLDAARRAAAGVGVDTPVPVDPPAPPKNGGRIGGYPTTSRFGGALGLVHEHPSMTPKVTKPEPKAVTAAKAKTPAKRSTPRSAPTKRTPS
ncbi:lysin A [Microbacterium phage ValentiniPuff]|uniref:Lysin A n=1 Tax=Microbacterium phage ValentiniPuff TaxID=2315705 RepID=A0A386KS05_9CAUD|nr:lysin A [Microbacterium phage ValentiniPuff]